VLTLNESGNIAMKTEDSARTERHFEAARPRRLDIRAGALEVNVATLASAKDVLPPMREPIFEDGDGYTWRPQETAVTLDMTAVSEIEYLRSYLNRVLVDLDESRRKESRLRKRIEEYVSDLVTCEAVATSNEVAMSILCRLDDLNTISEKDIGTELRTTRRWLALASLMKAGFVEHYGSMLRITDRGQQIARAIRCLKE